MEIMHIPRLEERLKAFSVKRSFETKITTLKESLDVVSAAVAEAKNSKKFLGILELTLAVGNYINGGTNRGRAFGFKLDSLHKLADVKTNNGSNLLGYIVELIETKYPHLDDIQVSFLLKVRFKDVLTRYIRMTSNISVMLAERACKCYKVISQSSREI